MGLNRFFVSPESIRGAEVRISGNAAHQVKNVLRLRAGDRILVLDDTGAERTVELHSVESGIITGSVIGTTLSTAEPRTFVCLYQAVLKARKLEWVLQKGTELGVSEFIPVVCDRSIVGHVQDVDGRQARWGTILREAAEQSRRGRLPCLLPATMFAQACQRAAETTKLNLILWEEERATSLKAALTAFRQGHTDVRSVGLFVGPEGGFTAEEVELAQQYGLHPVGLGPRILRAETAGLAAAAALFYEMEE